MRKVAPKTIEQQSKQALHRLRNVAVDDRTTLVNQVRGVLSEFGIVFNQGIKNLREGLPRLLEDATNELTHTFRDALALKYTQLLQLDESVN